jgi:acid phosphatase type 7
MYSIYSNPLMSFFGRLLALLLTGLPLTLPAQTEEKGLVGEWHFWQNYTLAGKAQNLSGPRIESPQTPINPVEISFPALQLYGKQPTERMSGFVNESKIPRKSFSIELWLVNHVNQPIGALATVRSAQKPLWTLSYFNGNVDFRAWQTPSNLMDGIQGQAMRGWKRYWYHLVGTFDGMHMKLYINGEAQAKIHSVKDLHFPEQAQLEIAAYLEKEPHMGLADLLKMVRLYDYALSASQITDRFTQLQSQVEAGKLPTNRFHFNAGPYLHYVTQHSVNLTWETDRPASVVIEYGTKLPLTEKMVIPVSDQNLEVNDLSAKLIGEATIRNLQPETSYFYNLKATSQRGETIESGILTFRTAVSEQSAFSFAFIGDTEARPHINNQIAKRIWEERPDFIVCAGDLSDGGKQPHKFEWNYEYFVGMNQIIGRIPVFPVPGNGEDDLYWYNRYHRLPEPENYYSFTYGNAEFFMLDSNPKSELAPGGKQYVWLENALQHSKATWKFVAHHFAPYSADEDDYGDSWQGTSHLGDMDIRKIVPLYEKYGVDMVLFGHLHTYNRSWPVKAGKVSPEGVIYLQSGGAGGNLEDFAPTRAWFSAKTYRGHHYCTLSIYGGQLSLKMYDLNGNLRDFIELQKAGK